MSAPLFDPSRDPFADMGAALEQAQRENKNILIDLGGDWCIWCHRLEQYIAAHPQLSALRDQYYITVKVYVGDEDTNADFLQHLPPFEGVPHLLVYNRKGQLLCSQATDPLEEGESYNYQRVEAFFTRWSDPRLTPWDDVSDEELRKHFAQQFVRPNISGPTMSA